MKKINSVLTALAIASLTLSAHAKSQFSPEQLEQFERTNKCSGCDLSGAQLSLNHSQAVLDNANLSGIYFIRPIGINFSQGLLTNANLSGAYLVSANFSQANLSGAHFDGAQLNGANFYGAKGVNLKNAANICDVTAADGSQLNCDGTIKK
jgi:uncharacterized protein YjbI with pentapeptide repeats